MKISRCSKRETRTFEAGPGSFRPELLVVQSATQLLGLVDGLPVFAQGPPFVSFYLGWVALKGLLGLVLRGEIEARSNESAAD